MKLYEYIFIKQGYDLTEAGLKHRIKSGAKIMALLTGLGGASVASSTPHLLDKITDIVSTSKSTKVGKTLGKAAKETNIYIRGMADKLGDALKGKRIRDLKSNIGSSLYKAGYRPGLSSEKKQLRFYIGK